MFLIIFILILIINQTHEDFLFSKKNKNQNLVNNGSKNGLECLKYFKNCAIDDTCRNLNFSRSSCNLPEVLDNSNKFVFIKYKIINSFKLFSLYENSAKIVADHQSIIRILPNVFNEKTNLKHISLLNNDLYSLDPSTFKDLKNLNLLVLSFNSLSNVSNLFTYLVNLEYLSLKKNNLISIQDGTFNNLTILKKLFLEENQITELNGNAFSDLKKLEILNISSNKLEYIQNDTFKNLIHLVHLDLSKNQMSNLSSLMFQNLTKLKNLSLSENKINFINTDTFKGLSNLERLILKKNELSSLDIMIFSDLENLIYLDLSHNKLKSFNCAIYSNLKILILKNNQLEYFKKNLTSLKELYLSYNPLKYLNYSIALADKNETFNLKILYLNNCNLTLITEEAFSNLINLNYIKLNSNINLNITQKNIFQNLNLTKLILDDHLKNSTLWIL